jgi:hypothetical protein
VTGNPLTSRVAVYQGTGTTQAMNPKSFSFFAFESTEEPTQ